MYQIRLYYIRKNTHLSMLITGLLGLQKQGLVTIKDVQLDRSNTRKLPHDLSLDMDLNGKTLRFDMADGYPEEPERLVQGLQGCDVCFKRSFSTERHAFLPAQLREKLQPLGLHYHVSCPGNFMDTPDGLRERINSLKQRIANSEADSYFTQEQFEGKPGVHVHPRVMFYAPLRSVPPTDIHYDSIQKINRDRITLVRELRRRYGERFSGGIQRSEEAKKLCPDLVVPIQETQRKVYLERMKNTDICIGTQGLHDSISWETAEYVAAARAIVLERPCFSVPGGFSEGVHYLGFRDSEECLAQVEWLMRSPHEIYALQSANEQYYQDYLKPERLVLRALRQVFPEAGER